MNIPRYSYNESIKSNLLQFLKEANEAKSDVYCDFKKYEQFKSLFPLHDEIKQDLKTYVENASVCIDITESDEEGEKPNFETVQNQDNDQVFNQVSGSLSNSIYNVDQSNEIDVIDSIRDSLSIQNYISDVIIKDLSNVENSSIEKIFSSLSAQLSLEDVEKFWNSLMIVGQNHNEDVILCFVKFLLLPRVKKEFTFELQAIFLSLSQKYSTVLKNQLAKELLEVDLVEKETNRTLHQYIGTLDDSFKADVLRCFLFTCEKLHQNYISVIDALVNHQSDYEVLSKLIEIMSNAVAEFSNDNTYGKLLYNVVNLLERNVSRLEQPVKHILGIHRSIWKIKVQKLVLARFDESLTQSFVS